MNPHHQREKAFHAIIYFLQHTSCCYKKKTYKLLWFLDSEFFQSIGRSVTGYQYYAWKMGPVPKDLHIAIDSGDPAFEEFFDIHPVQSGGYDAIELVGKKPFDEKYFSKKELDLLNDVSERFDMATAKELEDLTHLPGTPWYQVWEVEGNKQAPIPYGYALSNLSADDRETISNIAQEREAFLVNYQ